MKAVKEPEIQMAEFKEAKEKLAKLEASYDKSKMTVAEKTREIKALDNKIKTLDMELTLDKTLVEIKKILWAKCLVNLVCPNCYLKCQSESCKLLK